MNRLQNILFFLLIFFLPSQLSYHFWPSFSFVNGISVDYLSPTFYLTDLLVISLIALNIKSLKINKLLLLATLTFFAINVFYSAIPLLTLYKWAKVFEMAALILIIHKKESFKKIAFSTLPYAILWTAFVSIVQWFNGGSINGVMYFLGERSFNTSTPGIALSRLFSTVSLRPYATLPHPNALAGFVVVGFLLYVNKKKNFVYFLSGALAITSIILTESFAVWLTLLLLLFIKPFMFINKWKFFLLIIFILSLSSMYIVDKLKVNPSLVSNSSLERMELISESAIISSRSPIVGVGLGNHISEVAALKAHSPFNTSRTSSFLQPVHNVFLLVFSEAGIVGVVSMYSLLIFIGPSLPLVVIVLTSLFDHYWFTLQAPMLLVAIVMGITYNERKFKEFTESESESL